MLANCPEMSDESLVYLIITSSIIIILILFLMAGFVYLLVQLYTEEESAEEPVEELQSKVSNSNREIENIEKK